MCVVYLLTAGQRLCKNGGRIEIQDTDRNKIKSLPIYDVESIIVAAKTQLTYDVIKIAMVNNIAVTYVDRRGRIMGEIRNNNQNMDQLMIQQKCFNNEATAIKLAKMVLTEKIQSQEKLMSSFARTMGKAELKDIAETIKIYEKKINTMDKTDELMGLEGICSRVYFSGFGEILDSKKWQWNGRNRRPSLDPVNSLLSYGYTFLEGEVRIGIAGARLDERIGFLHSNNGRKDSLVFDLMEMFRQQVIDKFTLLLINKHIFSTEDFYYDEEDGCRLKDESRKKWIENYEEYITKERKMLDGLSWRHYIYKRIEKFAEMVWQIQLES